jgi:SAM-dependent methyltransferase
MLNHLVRYAPVVRLVRELGSGSVLEVGSGTAGLAGSLGPGFAVTALDRTFEPQGAPDVPAERVVGDVRSLSFADRSFDAVVALDVLEHVEPRDRTRALAELVRTTRRRLVVGCPTGERALAADRYIGRVLTGRGETYAGSWLEDHLEHGFPRRPEIAATLDRAGSVRCLRNENVWTHRVLMRAEVSRRTRRLTDALERMLAPALEPSGARAGAASVLLWVARGGDCPPTYRTIFVLDRD